MFPARIYLDDVLLTGLVLGRPVHGASSQIDGELRLGLVAAELLRTMDENEKWNAHIHYREILDYCLKTITSHTHTHTRFIYKNKLILHVRLYQQIFTVSCGLFILMHITGRQCLCLEPQTKFTISD